MFNFSSVFWLRGVDERCVTIGVLPTEYYLYQTIYLVLPEILISYRFFHVIFLIKLFLIFFAEILQSSIKYIEMSKNFLQCVDDETFQGLQLESLHLVDNNIQYFSEKCFKWVKFIYLVLRKWWCDEVALFTYAVYHGTSFLAIICVEQLFPRDSDGVTSIWRTIDKSSNAKCGFRSSAKWKATAVISVQQTPQLWAKFTDTFILPYLASCSLMSAMKIIPLMSAWIFRMHACNCASVRAGIQCACVSSHGFSNQPSTKWVSEVRQTDAINAMRTKPYATCHRQPGTFHVPNYYLFISSVDWLRKRVVISILMRFFSTSEAENREWERIRFDLISFSLSRGRVSAVECLQTIPSARFTCAGINITWRCRAALRYRYYTYM